MTAVKRGAPGQCDDYNVTSTDWNCSSKQRNVWNYVLSFEETRDIMLSGPVVD